MNKPLGFACYETGGLLDTCVPLIKRKIPLQLEPPQKRSHTTQQKSLSLCYVLDTGMSSVTLHAPLSFLREGKDLVSQNGLGAGVESHTAGLIPVPTLGS